MTPAQQELLRIPMSMSDPRGDMDRQGNPCLVVDAIINDNVMALAMRTRPLHTFLTNLVIAWANEKVCTEVMMGFCECTASTATMCVTSVGSSTLLPRNVSTNPSRTHQHTACA